MGSLKQHGFFHTKIRPVRFGLLTSLNKVDVLRSIELSSSLWGGSYNPLIPNFRRIDPSWKNGINSLTAAKLLSGYIDNFDPDVLVFPDGASIDENYKLFRRTAHIGEMEHSVYANKTDFDSRYEVPEFIVCLHKLIKDEYQYLRQDNSKILIPVFGSNSLALSAIFGSTNSQVLKKIKGNEYLSQFVEFPVLTMKDINRVLTSNDTFTRRVTLTEYGFHQPLNPQIYIFDHAKSADIIRYWNLRAAGNFVYPLPLSQDTLSDIDRVPDFFDQVLEKKDTPLAIRLSSSPNGKKEELTKELIDRVKTTRRVWTQSDYPHFHKSNRIGSWSSSLVKKIYVGWERGDIAVDDGAKVPLFRSELSKWSDSIDCINAIDIYYHDGPKLMAEVFPDCKDQYAYLGRPFSANARYNSEGIVIRVGSHSDSERLPETTSEMVLMYWMADQGWENGELSTSGKICTQILSLLEGKWLISILTYPGLLSLVNKGERKSGLNRDECLAILKTHGTDEKTAQWRLEMLIQYGILKVGYSTSCSHCKQTNWYSLSDIDYKLRCNRCLTKFRVDTADPNKLIWACRVSGPFAHTEFSGSFSPLLAYRLLESLYQSTSAIFGFKGQHEGREFELDLLCFLKDSFTEEDTSLIVGECKTTNRFKDKDTQRLYDTTSKFKNSFVLFATMNDLLNDAEVNLLTAFRKRMENNNLNSELIILTRKELCCRRVDDWAVLSDTHKQTLCKYNRWPSKIRWLSKVTVEVHLGIESLSV